MGGFFMCLLGQINMHYVPGVARKLWTYAGQGYYSNTYGFLRFYSSSSITIGEININSQAISVQRH